MIRSLVPLLLLAACFEEPAFHASGSGDDDASSGEPPNLMFVTSTTQAAGTLGSLSGADALCNRLAMVAGLSGTYVAWLSDSTTSARQRLGSASGWVRVDDQPFASTIEDLVAGKIWYPPRIDEGGHDHPDATELALTATNPDGTGDAARTCQSFTSLSTTDAAQAGFPTGGTSEWTQGASNAAVLCGSAARLYCFGIDHHAVVPPPTGTGRLAFVTSQSFTFSSTGITKADDLCTSEAASASLPGTYKALIATTGAPAVSRFDGTGAPWYRTDGVLVTSDLMNLSAPIDVGAGKQYLADTLGTAVWTGSIAPSAAGNDSSDCISWTNNTSGNANAGDPFASSTLWWKAPLGSVCATSHGVYCFQQ